MIRNMHSNVWKVYIYELQLEIHNVPLSSGCSFCGVQG